MIYIISPALFSTTSGSGLHSLLPFCSYADTKPVCYVYNACLIPVWDRYLIARIFALCLRGCSRTSARYTRSRTRKLRTGLVLEDNVKPHQSAGTYCEKWHNARVAKLNQGHSPKPQVLFWRVVLKITLQDLAAPCDMGSAKEPGICTGEVCKENLGIEDLSPSSLPPSGKRWVILG